MEAKNGNLNKGGTTRSAEEVKVFLKIKPVEFSDDKPYYKLHENKQVFTLFDKLRKVDSDKSLIFEMDKIFTDEENSYIYEEVCRDTVNEVLKGKNFSFIGYGLAHTSKKSTLIGGRESVTNINSRGIFFRVLENLTNIINTDKTDLSLNISYAAVYGNKYMDLSTFISKNITEFKDEEQVLSHFKDVKKSTDFSYILKKVPVSDVNEVIHFYSQIMSLFYKLEAFEKRLYSRTNFMFFLTLANNNGQTVSHVSFCLLEGSEKLTLSSNRLKSASNNNLNGASESGLKIRGSIYKENNFDNLLNCISLLKSPEFDSSKLKDIPFDDSPLTAVLRGYISKHTTKFRVVGCIQPNTGYHESVKDTLMFLFRCKKSIYDKSSAKQNLKSPEIKRDEVLYELENKIKAQEKNITKLNEVINQLQKKLESENANYKKNLEIVKTAFAFEGDINKLALDDEYVKEAKYARSIRDSMDMVRLLNKKMVDLEKKIEDLKEENKKLQLEKRIIENDQMMVNMYTRLKEDNLHEENKIKIMLENSKEIENIKSENEILHRQIELYRKEVEEKNKFIHNLPTLLKDKIDDKKDKSQKANDIKNEIELKYKKTLKETQHNFQKEIKINKETYEGMLKQKEEEMEGFKKEINTLKHRLDYEMNKYSDEMVKIYKNLQKSIESYRKLFDMRRLGSNANSITSFTSFLKSKENYDKICDNISENLIRYNYPLLFNILDSRKVGISTEVSGVFGNGIPLSTSTKNLRETKDAPVQVTKKSSPKKNKTIENHINININMQNYNKNNLSLSASDISQEIERLKPGKNYKIEELESMDKIDLMNVIHELQRSIKDFEQYLDGVKKDKRGLHGNTGGKTQDEEMIKLYKENEKLRRKLEEQVRVNKNNKISLHSQERMIEKLKGQNFINSKSGTASGGFFPKNDLKTATQNKPYRPASPLSLAIASPANILSPSNRGNSVNPKNNSTSNKFRPMTGRSANTFTNLNNI